jgi:hypothetical protein
MSTEKDSSSVNNHSDAFLSAMKDDPEKGQYGKLLKSLIVLAIVTYVKFELKAVNMATFPTIVIVVLAGFGAYAMLSMIIRIVTSMRKQKPAQSDPV